jgi:hypothetical protein
VILQSWNNCVLFRCRGPGDAAGMATLAQKIEAEKRMRDLLEEGGLPQPDYVEYGYTCIRLFYVESKTCVVIDIDDRPDGANGPATDGTNGPATDDLDPAA